MTHEIKPRLTMATFEKSEKQVACKLTSPELQKHKKEVLKSLKAKIKEKEELAEGYRYKFDGGDAVLDEVIQFIKTERACCKFFTFQLSVEDETSPIRLTISGPEGAKKFITAEMDL